MKNQNNDKTINNKCGSWINKGDDRDSGALPIYVRTAAQSWRFCRRGFDDFRQAPKGSKNLLIVTSCDICQQFRLARAK